MNKKFWASFGSVFVVLAGLFYVMQNCGGNEEFNRRSILNVTEVPDDQNDVDQNNENEQEEEIASEDESKDAMALLLECSNLSENEIAMTEDTFSVSEANQICSELKAYNFAESKTNNDAVPLEYE